MPKDLAGYIRQLKQSFPGDVLEITRTANPYTHDVTAILAHLTNANRFPLVHFKSVLDLHGEVADYSFVSNVFATRERCATALDFPREQSKLPLALEFARRERQHINADTVAPHDAPVKQEIETGEAVDLRRLPIARHFRMDLGPYTTMACVMRDPDEGFYDISFIKWMYKGPRRAGVVLHSNHFVKLLAKYEERQQPAPIINILGHHPAFYLASLSLAPWGSNDYDHVGAFLCEPLRLTPSETWGSDFLVPADAEIVVEGIMPPGERTVVNPFGEYTRLYQPQFERPVVNVTALTHRRHAIYQDVFSGHHGHWTLGGIPKEGSIYNAVREKFDGIAAVHMPHSGTSRTTCYISINKDCEERVQMVAEEAFANSPQIRVVVVVDDDIDVFNETDVIWAVITWTNFKRGVSLAEIERNGRTRQKVVVNATRPRDVPVPERIRVPDEAIARIKLEEWID